MLPNPKITDIGPYARRGIGQVWVDAFDRYQRLRMAERHNTGN